MPTEFDKWRDQKIIEIADEVAEIRERSMDIRQIVEDTLVAPFRAVEAVQRATVAQERAATDNALPATEPAVTDASELQIGAGSKTAAVLENGNAIASAGNSTLELPASERGDCDCCGKRPYKYTGVFYGIETAYCWECAGETAEEQDE